MDEADARGGCLKITRQAAVSLAEDELLSITGHLLNMDALCQMPGFEQWRGGIEQLRAALQRLENDVETTKTARVQ